MFDLINANVLSLRVRFGFQIGMGSIFLFLLSCLSPSSSADVKISSDANPMPGPCLPRDIVNITALNLQSESDDGLVDLGSLLSARRFQMLADDVSESESASDDGAGGQHSQLKCEHRVELLINFSRASSAFIECAVLSAKPIRFCEHCVCEYHTIRNAFEAIQNDNDCKEDILVSDRLQIVSKTHSFVVKLWQDGFCEKCYKDFEPTNATKVFLRMFEETKQCFLEHGGSFPDHAVENDTMCQNCSRLYTDLNNFYNKLGEECLCMDIIDLMNRTRIEWKEQGCIIHLHDFSSVIAITSFVLVLPLFFYLIAKIHGTKKEQKILRRSENIPINESSTRLFAGTTQTLR